jgi:cytochrome c-type biogenesis protein CcmH/NrfG
MQDPIRNSIPTLGVCLVLAALVWIVFGQTRHYPFVNYDDPGYVAENPDVARGLNMHGVAWAFTHVHGGNWHPLTTLSHMLDCQLFGLHAGAHHLVNVFLHTIAAIVLFLVLRAMTGTVWRSAFVAAVFAIHPLRVESVAWISERKDVLSAVFFMLTLGAYLRYVGKPSVARYLLIAVLFALGLMSKPMLITLPLVLLLLDYWPLQRSQRSEVRDQRSDGEVQRRSFSRLVIEKIPLFVLSAATCVAAVLARKKALGSSETMPVTWRVVNSLVSCVIYLRQLFWPAGLAVLYPHPENRLPLWEPVAAGVLLLALTYLAFACRKRFPYVLTGWLWYLVMLAPVLGIIQVGLQGHADRFTYLPQIGLCLIVAWGVHDLSAKWPLPQLILAAGAAAALVALVWTARIQTAYWRDSEILWTRTLAVTTDNDVAHTNFSELLLRRKRPQEAIVQAKAAIKARPDNAQACANLGLAYMRTGQITPAVAYLQRSLQLRPEGVNAALNLAWIYATCPDGSLRDGEKAIDLAESVVERGDRTDPYPLHTLAAAYAEAQRFAQAVDTAEEAVKLASQQGNYALLQELQLNLKNYRDFLPLRDPVLIGGQPVN